MDTRPQAKGAGFVRHRAGRIGASVSGSAFNCNLAQPPQSLIKSIANHTSLQQHSMVASMKTMPQSLRICLTWLPDIMWFSAVIWSWGGKMSHLYWWGPWLWQICYRKELLPREGKWIERFQLKRHHNQGQQQLFTVRDRNFCDFVVCGIGKEKNANITKERIYPDLKRWESVLPKLELYSVLFSFVFCLNFLAVGTQGSVLYMFAPLMSMESTFVVVIGMKISWNVRISQLFIFCINLTRECTVGNPSAIEGQTANIKNLRTGL